MDRGWYVRFVAVVTLVVLAWLAVWPSLGDFVPAPPWVKELFTHRISPGLDIRGGLRLMYEVEVDEAIRDRRDTRVDWLQTELGEKLGLIEEGSVPSPETMAKIRDQVQVEPVGEERIRVTFSDPANTDKLDRDLITFHDDLREISRAEAQILLEVKPDILPRIRETAVDQAKQTISNRIDTLGLREAAVTAQDTDIIVEVPGADQEAFDRIREIISKTARLEFQIVADQTDFVATLEDVPEGIERQSETVSAGPDNPQVTTSFLVARGDEQRQKLRDYLERLREGDRIPAGHELLIGRLDSFDDESPELDQTEAWRTYYLHARADVTGQAIEDAFVANDPQTNKPYVAVNFKGQGIDDFAQLTGRNVKRRMAIVLDDRVASAPVIQQEIGGGRCQITLGGFRDYNELLNEANDLVIVLKAGALPVPIRPANEQMIGPTLGADAIRKATEGGLVGVLLLLLFMFVYYRTAGAIADLMVLLNLLFLLALLASFEATLTLPGIAGIALGLGMAVDANVLVTERIREELRAGKSTRAAIDQGFGRALWAILDSQFTTFLAGVVLFQFGTGPIKGFAVTLMFGIVTSLFTGVFCSRVVFDWIARGLKVQRLGVG